MTRARYDDGTVTVSDRGIDVLRYRATTPASKPHVDRLALPADAGATAGRNLLLSGAHDHPWHLGAFFSPKYVDGINCWEYEANVGDGDPCARAVDRGHDLVCEGDTVEIEQAVAWRSEDGETLLADERTVGLHVSLDRGYLVTWDQAIEAVGADRRIEGSDPSGGQGSYGGFSLRFSREMAGGTVRLPDAEDPDDRSGPTGRYCAYTGPLDGRRGSTDPWRAGCAVLIDPEVGRSQRWFVARGYPFVGANPTWDETAPLDRGETWRFRWGIWVHDGRVDRAAIEAVHDRFVALGSGDRT